MAHLFQINSSSSYRFTSFLREIVEVVYFRIFKIYIHFYIVNQKKRRLEKSPR